jgi:hypothetical protein
MRKQMILWIVAGVVVVPACALSSAGSARGLDSPTITGIAPAAAQPGKTVTITGIGLTGATVSFQKAKSSAPPVTATQAETIVSSDGNQILVTIPDGSDAANGMTAPSGMDELIVATPGGSVTAHFMVRPLEQTGQGPVITGLMPHRTLPGRTVTITGAHLSGATGVWLAGRKVRFKVPSDSKILALIPKNARSGRLSVKTAVGITASSMRLTVITPTT